MSELQRDCNSVINVGGDLIYVKSATPSGGEPVEYPDMPVGGPPGFNTCDDVRSAYEWSLVLEIPGDTQTERNTFISKFAAGTQFTTATAASSSSEMEITGERAAVGTVYQVLNNPVVTNFQQNSEMTVTMKEKVPVATGAGSGTGS